jgi:hypothetical protein
MKKTLNVTAITNELKGESLFFPPAKNESTAAVNKTAVTSTTAAKATELARTPEQVNARTGEQVNERTGEQVNERTAEQANTRTPERVNARTTPDKKPKRAIVRHSFQFYSDQIIRLKRLHAQKTLLGEDCNLSILVRAALDDYLHKIDEQANT